MSFEHNELHGSLFKNKYKEPGSKQPDYRGACKIGGVTYDIAAWVKQDKTYQNYFSFKFQIPTERGAQVPKDRQAEETKEAEDLPF